MGDVSDDELRDTIRRASMSVRNMFSPEEYVSVCSELLRRREAAALIDSQASEIAVLTEALGPFADLGETINHPFGEALFNNSETAFSARGKGCEWTVNGEDKRLTWGDFRRLATPSPPLQNPRIPWTNPR
jgi:hypothetical protein